MGEFINAFVAGFLSFVSPCVLPLVPVYLSIISGVSMQELQEGGKGSWWRVLSSAVLFVLGFSIVFSAVGASASKIGEVLFNYRTILTQIGGGFVVLLGLVFIGVAKIPVLQQEKRFHITRPAGFFGPVLVGMAFAFGWTPCIAGFAITIINYAMNAETVTRGAGLLLTYSLGLGVPLIVTAMVFSRALVAFNWIKRHYGSVTLISGLLLILMGVLLLTDKMTVVQGWFS